jgi:hypothetical protein
VVSIDCQTEFLPVEEEKPMRDVTPNADDKEKGSKTSLRSGLKGRLEVHQEINGTGHRKSPRCETEHMSGKKP